MSALDGMSVRSMEPGDYNFIISTWMKSMPKKVRDHFRPIVEQHLEQDSVLVLCDTEVPGTIYAWLCHRENVVQWNYVVFAFRGKGLSSKLHSSIERE